MQAEKRWHILLSVILLLITSSRSMDSKEVTHGDKHTLLDLLLHVIRDSERERLNTREKSTHSRPIEEIVLRDVSIKDRFIKHFTGPVKFPSECRMHFHRIYHNTRECSRPTYTEVTEDGALRNFGENLFSEEVPSSRTVSARN